MLPTARTVLLVLLILSWQTARCSAGPAEKHETGTPIPVFAPLPNPVSSFGATVCDGFIYVYGGHAGTAHVYEAQTSLGTFHRSPISGGKWESLPGGPGLIGVSIASVGRKIYRVGGTHARNGPGEKADLLSVDDVAVFDPQTKVWGTFPKLPAGRSSHDVVAVGSRLIVVGGWQMTGAAGNTSWADTALICDTAAAEPKWEAVRQPFRRRALAAAAIGNLVYVIGGLTEAGEAVRTVDVLDVSSGKWSVGPAYPGTEQTGFNPSACELGGRLYLNALDRSVFRLNKPGTAWEKIAATTEARYVHRLVPVNREMIAAIAGASPKGPHASVEVVVVDGRLALAGPADGSKVQKFCPIMTTDEVDPENSRAFEYDGVKVLLCCDTCVARFRRDPAAYLDQQLIPGLAEKQLPKRIIEQMYCPVYTDRKVSSKDPFVTYAGVKVYVFNELAKQRFEKDPSRYADPKILPQLPKVK